MEKKDKKISFATALSRAQMLCARQERCTYDIQQKLTTWGLLNPDLEKVLEVLTKDGFINDERYAMMFVRDKYKLNKWGPLKIKQALKLKRISEQVIQNSLNEIDLSGSERDLISILDKKSKSIKVKSAYDMKVKLIRFAISRGFEYEMVVRIVDKRFSNLIINQ